MSSEKAKLFVVEDTVSLLARYVEWFQQIGYSVSGFNDPRDLMSVEFDRLRPSVIVSDMRMPNMSGLQLMQYLRASRILLPFVFVSGESTHQEIVEAYQDPSVQYVLKPAKLQDLLAAIERAATLDQARIFSEAKSSRLHSMKDQLTPTQQLVFDHLLLSKNINEIASELGIRAESVKKHRQAIFQKLSCGSIYEFLRLCGRI